LLDLGPGKKKMTREVGSTIQKDDLVLLNLQDYPELLYLDVKSQSLDRRPWDPPFKGAI
jgi:hypothetical protein